MIWHYKGKITGQELIARIAHTNNKSITKADLLNGKFYGNSFAQKSNLTEYVNSDTFASKHLHIMPC